MKTKLIGSFIYLALFPVILFILAGDWRWIEGWLFSVIFLVMCHSTLLYLYFYDPALLKERFGSPFQPRLVCDHAARRQAISLEPDISLVAQSNRNRIAGALDRPRV